MGDSPRETELNKLLGEARAFKPTVSNLFGDYKDESSTSDILRATEAFTSKVKGDIQRDTATDIKRAGSGVARRFAGAGVTKGSLFEDAVAGAENKVRGIGAKSVSDIMSKQLSLVPNILEGGNRRKFARTSASQNTLFANKQNEFGKFNLLAGLGSQLPDDTTFDDILEILNTAGEITDAVIPG